MPNPLTQPQWIPEELALSRYLSGDPTALAVLDACAVFHRLHHTRPDTLPLIARIDQNGEVCEVASADPAQDIAALGIDLSSVAPAAPPDDGSITLPREAVGLLIVGLAALQPDHPALQGLSGAVLAVQRLVVAARSALLELGVGEARSALVVALNAIDGAASNGQP